MKAGKPLHLTLMLAILVAHTVLLSIWLTDKPHHQTQAQNSAVNAEKPANIPTKFVAKKDSLLHSHLNVHVQATGFIIR